MGSQLPGMGELPETPPEEIAVIPDDGVAGLTVSTKGHRVLVGVVDSPIAMGFSHRQVKALIAALTVALEPPPAPTPEETLAKVLPAVMEVIEAVNQVKNGPPPKNKRPPVDRGGFRVVDGPGSLSDGEIPDDGGK
jgi:hypothetical protein